jgi:hypothetical protein
MRTISVKAILIGLLLTSMLVLAIGVPALATGAQNWYLNSTSRSGNLVMDKARGGQSGSITVPANSTRYWLADQAALDNVTFPQGVWVIGLKTDVWTNSSTSAVLTVGQWKTSFTPFSTNNRGKLSYNAGRSMMTFELQTGPQTILKGNFLALEVTNNDTISHVITTDGRSFIESPSSDPGYPLPEVATIVLLGTGLAGLFGYIRLKSLPAGSKA